MSEIIIEKVRESFNSACKTYDNFCDVQRLVSKDVINLLLKYNDKFDNAVDMACGTGVSTQMLLSNIKNEKLFAVDFAEDLLGVARKKLPAPVHCICFDFDAKIFPESSLDLVFSNMGLQWSPDLIKTFSLFSNYLKKNALIAFSLPTYFNFPEINPQFKMQMPRHDDVLTSLERSGFKVIESIKKDYLQSFSTPVRALRSLKKVGANYYAHDSKNKSSARVGLSKSYLKDVFINTGDPTLTYKISIFLARAEKL